MSEAKTVTVLTQDLLNAQVGVLGSMLIDEECVGFVLSRVSERDFVTQQYRSIFRAIRTLFREGLPTDAIAVREKLGGKLGDGWSKLLTGIMDYTPTAANVDGYVQMLKEKSALYQLQELGAALQNAADMNDARSILDKAMQLQVGRPGIHALTFAKGYEEFFDRHSGETAVEHLDWATLKAVCEGRELPAYEAAAEFTAQTSGELDNLLSQLGGKPGAVQTLEKLEQAEKTAEDKLAALLEQLRGAPQDDPALSAAVVKAANDAENKRRQADAVNKLVDAGLAQNQAEAGALIARAVSAAAERAEEVQTILGAWSDAPGDMRKTDANAALLERVRDSKTLQDISRYLGRFREIFAQGKRNGYAYGRGEKYALELGNDLSRALTSELAMLAVPETLPLFLRKYQHRQIKQYRRREPVYKGAGDIICCLDESGSTAGDLAAWGKAVALTLLEIAQSEGRKFALVHFSGPGRFQTDVFLPGQSSLEEKLHAAETFLGGGTDFQTPLAEAERLMREGGFENADIAFITDGECSLPETCVEMLQKAQSELRFTVTGILLDEGNAGMDFSLKPFCQNIYRTSELTGDQIVGEIVLDRV